MLLTCCWWFTRYNNTKKSCNADPVQVTEPLQSSCHTQAASHSEALRLHVPAISMIRSVYFLLECTDTFVFASQRSELHELLRECTTSFVLQMTWAKARQRQMVQANDVSEGPTAANLSSDQGHRPPGQQADPPPPGGSQGPAKTTPPIAMPPNHPLTMEITISQNLDIS